MNRSGVETCLYDVGSVLMSLDGYIAGPDGEFDWIVMDPDIDFAAMSEQFDTYFCHERCTLGTSPVDGGAVKVP